MATHFEAISTHPVAGFPAMAGMADRVLDDEPSFGAGLPAIVSYCAGCFCPMMSVPTGQAWTDGTIFAPFSVRHTQQF